MSFSQAHRVFIFEYCLGSYLVYQDDFGREFPDSFVPCKSTIFRLMKRFRDTGNVNHKSVPVGIQCQVMSLWETFAKVCYDFQKTFPAE
jgi:hypothetical protein